MIISLTEKIQVTEARQDVDKYDKTHSIQKTKFLLCLRNVNKNELFNNLDNTFLIYLNEKNPKCILTACNLLDGNNLSSKTGKF